MMDELQETWQEVLLGNERYFQLGTGGTPSTEKKEYWENGTIPWLSSGEVHKKIIYEANGRITEKGFRNSNARFYPTHSILIALAGQGKTRGTAAITEIEATSNQSIAAVIPNKELVEPYFIYYFIDSLYEDLRSSSAGAGRAGLNLSILANVSIKLPAKPIQKSVAAVLSCIDRAIEHTEALIAKQQRIKTGLMQDLLTRGIDEHGNIRSEATHEFKDSPLGRIPKEWKSIMIDKVGSVRLGRQRSPKHQSGRFTTPYLRVANVFDGWIDYSDVLSMDFTPNEKETYSLLPNDILLNEGQSLELVGRSAIYEGESNQFCFQNTLVRFRAFKDNHAGYCQLVFKHWLDTGRFIDVARQTTSVAHLGADRFAQMYFPRSSFEEQQRIYSVLKAKGNVIQSQKNHLKNLHQIKKGLMQDLLTGKVSVESLRATKEQSGDAAEN